MDASSNILLFEENTPTAIIKGIAQRVKSRRLEKNLTQREMAQRSGMGYENYRRFETTGEIALLNLIRCAFTLDATDEFAELFRRKSFQNMDDLLGSTNTKERKRATKNG